ncbi:hypothetical protein R16034_00861 [Ralstonia edaphis]|uniref:Uncharacterized protein n=1 Tax=Ralstonia edaphi TaxID=3058599 RepID=A0AB72WXA6_9RALS|nr:hypothetical protein [Ralstonia sp. LMG 6871]CAJ0737825.1 hypothetical protein R16034_00861 [Ralstonia sp. LMG 6871]
MTQQSALSRILETSAKAFIPAALGRNNWMKDEAQRVIDTTRKHWGIGAAK